MINATAFRDYFQNICAIIFIMEICWDTCMNIKMWKTKIGFIFLLETFLCMRPMWIFWKIGILHVDSVDTHLFWAIVVVELCQSHYDHCSWPKLDWCTISFSHPFLGVYRLGRAQGGPEVRRWPAPDPHQGCRLYEGIPSDGLLTQHQAVPSQDGLLETLPSVGTI